MRTFDARVEKCSPATRKLVAFLRIVAEHAGAYVEPPIADKKGVGITYTRGRKQLCRFDPKHQADHVWASIQVPIGTRSGRRERSPTVRMGHA